MESFDNRLSALESSVTQQSCLSNDQVQLVADGDVQDDQSALCHHSFETSSIDQISVSVPPDLGLDTVSPEILDTHDCHKNGSTKGKSPNPVPNNNSAYVSTSNDCNRKQNSPAEKETDRLQLFSPTAESPSWFRNYQNSR
jgi:hypothetical protein